MKKNFLMVIDKQDQLLFGSIVTLMVALALSIVYLWLSLSVDDNVIHSIINHWVLQIKVGSGKVG